MAGKSKKTETPKTDYRSRQQRVTQIVIVVISVILILSWVLSLVAQI